MSTSTEDLKSDLAVIKTKIEFLEAQAKDNDHAAVKAKLEHLEKLVEDLVTRPEFAPVKMIAYGMAGSVLLTVLGAILSKVI